MNNINKKDKHRFNIIDILIIAAVIAAITFSANILMNDLFSGNMKNIEYVIKLSDVSSNDINDLVADYKLTAKTTNAYIGTISKVEGFNKSTYAFNFDTDRFVKIEHPNKYDLYITVKAVCSQKNNMYYVNNNIISANRKLDIVVPFYYSNAEIVEVSLSEEI